MQPPLLNKTDSLTSLLAHIVNSTSPTVIEHKALWYYLKNLNGTIYRDVKNRQTKAITINDRTYFIKLHARLSWKEALKPVFQGRLPIIGAHYEWQAIARCEQSDILTTPRVAYGCWGYWVWQRSLLITNALTQMCSLEELGQRWQTQPPNVKLKRQIIKILANTARKFHGQGMNHCDFYACHFLVPNTVLTATQPVDNLVMHIMDLHRVRIRQCVPRRWLIKDLSALLFSILDYPITYHDCLFFLRYYYKGKDLTTVFSDQPFWRNSIKRAFALYRKENKAPARTSLALTLQKFL